MVKVSAFPFLTADEFIEACTHVQPLLSDSALLADDFACLRVTRRLAAALVVNADGQEHADSHFETPEDHDEEAIIKYSQNGSFVTVHYDILLSPSYRVPVVYMTASPPLPVSHFFDLVVPHHFRDAMRETGVMGALSMTDHPLTGMPAYFVHPCSTADTMCATKSGDIHVQDYMLLWLGIVGASVGLHVSSADLRRAD
ncbi:hypothetical protein E4T50_05039 [Aureobasidium sp. EXF-12298]|nr:hypothetical protein E4T50_05039 [Aureobasidium sp. EXF-12298]KAI4762118.1 hypothetical protein E4T51_04874 [Aureobasidium sp. EXF-12344]KAI4779416.1 hypothetical protein E4T52_05699 [Aureobasidium sp. EXF-3400]